MNYDRAYSEVILSRWDETSGEQKDLAERLPNRQGQLREDEPDSHALHDTWKYQRGHADAFSKVFKEAIHSPLRKGERLLVVDIGAGAATVAVAIGEALGRSKRRRVDYMAFDPHPMMQELGTQLLERLSAGFRTARYVDSLEDVDFTGTDRLLFTLSYVVHQKSVSSGDIEEWANLIERAVTEMERGVELIYTTAAGLSGGRHHDLRGSLERTGILRNRRPVQIQVPRRGPGVVGNDGQIDWKAQREFWKVQAEHWTLRK